jgi:CRISPR-associated endonuclease/helicase Cas3
VVVGASRGGLGGGTWDPDAKTPVDDVAEPATFAVRKLAKLRVDSATLPKKLREGLPTPTNSDEPDEIEASRQACQTWLDGLAGRLDDAPSSWHDLLRALAKSDEKQRTLVAADSASGARVWWVTVVPRARAIEATTEDDVSVFTGVAVTLAQHLDDVEAWAGAFARSAGLDHELAQDVALAGLLHDLGKADPRFQALLRGGDPIDAPDGEPLAKSRQFGSFMARQRAQRRSGWPGLRHELISLALLDASTELQARAHDLELVRHLVASHHGWCRPWAPTTIDPEPTMVRFEVAGVHAEVSTAALDDAFSNECASRFRRLCRRYGWHGLAYLEALLRLGDHRASDRPGASNRPGTRPEGQS